MVHNMKRNQLQSMSCKEVPSEEEEKASLENKDAKEQPSSTEELPLSGVPPPKLRDHGRASVVPLSNQLGQPNSAQNQHLGPYVVC